MGIPWEAMSDREKAAQFAAGVTPTLLDQWLPVDD